MAQADAVLQRGPRSLAPTGRFEQALVTTMGVPFFAGNRLTVLRNGIEIFPAMLSAIESARREIIMLTFVYWTGNIAERFAHSLAARARAGVRVRLLLDAVGARQMHRKLVDLMQRAGVELRWFRPPSRKFWRVNHRTHRKVLICDGHIGFTGGVGIAKEWEGDARNPKEWRDTHLRIEGPAVHGLRAAFLGNWLETRADSDPIPLEESEPIEACGEVPLQVVRATASVGWSDVATLVWTLLKSAREQIRITTAYFVPDPATIGELIAAAERGVDIRLIVPGPHNDARASELAGNAIFQELLEAGVRVLEYQRTMHHAKIITVDGVVACMGSANFNQRSMRLDDELCVTAVHAPTVRLLDAHFDEDAQYCQALDPKRWSQRGALQRVQEWAARRFYKEL